MNFEWDAAKNRSNIRKHGFDLADAAEMFQGALLVRPDTREEYGESRWIGIGMIRHRIAVVAFAERADETVRSKKKQITLRLDPDVLAFFRKHGKGYQTTINAVLRKYVEGRKRSAG